jgi:hypothetical protein
MWASWRRRRRRRREETVEKDLLKWKMETG